MIRGPILRPVKRAIVLGLSPFTQARKKVYRLNRSNRCLRPYRALARQIARDLRFVGSHST